MSLDLFYKGKKYAEVRKDKIIFIDKKADLNAYLDQLVAIGHETDAKGNRFCVKCPPSLQMKLIELHRLGFEIRKKDNKRRKVKR
jgi:hypothetical protein